MNGNLINFEITGAELHNSPVAAERIERIAEARIVGWRGKNMTSEKFVSAREKILKPIISRYFNRHRSHPEFDKYRQNRMLR